MSAKFSTHANSARRRWLYILAMFMALVASAFFVRNYLQEQALHALPIGFNKFSIYAPLPDCARWKDHMPSTRDPEIYRPYIEARKLWRSKIEWELTREEAMRILNDVKKAADLGDWGARPDGPFLSRRPGAA